MKQDLPQQVLNVYSEFDRVEAGNKSFGIRAQT